MVCRASVAAALLCSAQTQLALQETALHLQHYLTATPVETSSTAVGLSQTQSSKSALLADALAVLSTAARLSTSFPDTLSSDIYQAAQTAASIPALMQLLEAVTAAGSDASLSVLSRWFKESIASATEQYPNAVLSEILPVVIPALRSSETHLLSSGLSELAQQKLACSARLPPIAAMVDQPQASDHSTDCVQALEIICSCFLCSTSALMSTGGGQADHTAAADITTAAERKALLAAAMRQISGERSVAVAAAAARRAADGQDPGPPASSSAVTVSE